MLCFHNADSLDWIIRSLWRVRINIAFNNDSRWEYMVDNQIDRRSSPLSTCRNAHYRCPSSTGTVKGHVEIVLKYFFEEVRTWIAHYLGQLVHYNFFLWCRANESSPNQHLIGWRSSTVEGRHGRHWESRIRNISETSKRLMLGMMAALLPQDRSARVVAVRHPTSFTKLP